MVNNELRSSKVNCGKLKPKNKSKCIFLVLGSSCARDLVKADTPRN